MLSPNANHNRGGGDSLIKVGMDVQARALGISGVNFCQSIRFWEVNFACTLGFWQFLTRKCVIIDKRVKKSDLLAENFQFWHFKSHENLPGH